MDFGITGALGEAYGGGKALYGTKPIVPGPIDYEKALEEAIATNKKLLPQLAELGSASTDAMADLLEKAMPGYKSLRDRTTSNISAMSRGDLPNDVEDRINRWAAERGITTGTYGSDFGEHGAVRSLGLTSLDMVSKGLDSAMRWIESSQNRTFDFSRMFLDKESAMRKTEFNWNRDWLDAQVTAAPDPQARGAFDSEMAFLGMVMSIYGGGAGYTGQYKQQYQNGNSGGGGGSGGGFFGGGSNTNYNINSNPGGSGYSNEFYDAGPQ